MHIKACEGSLRDLRTQRRDLHITDLCSFDFLHLCCAWLFGHCCGPSDLYTRNVWWGEDGGGERDSESGVGEKEKRGGGVE